MARMHDCGGLMMAVNWVTSYMPRLEIVNVPPYQSGRLLVLWTVFLVCDPLDIHEGPVSHLELSEQAI